MPSAGQIAKIAKIFNDLKGDLVQVANAVGADFAAITKSKPKDANDFAVKVLAGAYTTEDYEGFRRRLSGVLHRDMLQLQQADLKRTNTIEKIGALREEDIAQIAQVFTEHEGNLMKLASVLECDAELLKKDAPTDARKFAERHLIGSYQKK